MGIPEITVQELKQMRDDGQEFTILDVRDPDEFAICNLGGQLIPLRELPNRLDEVDKTKPVIVHCKLGGRSSMATKFLLEKGYPKVFNLKGGIHAWATQIDCTMKTY